MTTHRLGADIVANATVAKSVDFSFFLFAGGDGGDRNVKIGRRRSRPLSCGAPRLIGNRITRTENCPVRGWHSSPPPKVFAEEIFSFSRERVSGSREKERGREMESVSETGETERQTTFVRGFPTVSLYVAGDTLKKKNDPARDGLGRKKNGEEKKSLRIKKKIYYIKISVM